MTSWIKEAVFYHIYPLGFVGAAQYHEEEITHSIKKVEDWIPHMKKLGVNALYLGPVFESHEHGYDTSDYRLLDHRLGTTMISRGYATACMQPTSASFWMVCSITSVVISGHFAMFRKRRRNQPIATGFPTCTFMHAVR